MASAVGLEASSPRSRFVDFRLERSGAEAREHEQGRIGESAKASVCRLIEYEVIPRLLVAHSEPVRRLTAVGDDATINAGAAINAGEVDRFAPLTLMLEADALLEEIDIFLRRGASVETLFVDLLAPAARWLGRRWDEDELDFIDVTMGLWRLQEVLREVAARTPRIARPASACGAALFAPMPGEQHAFGSAMVEECFARAGWDTELAIDTSRSDLLDLVASRGFDLLGLTVSGPAHIERLPSLILTVRSVSRNPNICVMVGGPALCADPSLAQAVGADGTAATASMAVRAAETMVGKRAARPAPTA